MIVLKRVLLLLLLLSVLPEGRSFELICKFYSESYPVVGFLLHCSVLFFHSKSSTYCILLLPKPVGSYSLKRFLKFPSTVSCNTQFLLRMCPIKFALLWWIIKLIFPQQLFLRHLHLTLCLFTIFFLYTYPAPHFKCF